MIDFRPLINNFALDSELVIDLCNNWKTHRRNKKNSTNKNVEHFRSMIDGESNKIDRLFFICKDDEDRKNLNRWFDDNPLSNPCEANNIPGKNNTFYDTLLTSRDPNQGAVKQTTKTTKKISEERILSFQTNEPLDWSITFGLDSNIRLKELIPTSIYIDQNEILNNLKSLSKKFTHEKGSLVTFHKFLGLNGKFNTDLYTAFLY